METCVFPDVKQPAGGSLLYTPGAQPRALCQPRGMGWSGNREGGLGGRGRNVYL